MSGYITVRAPWIYAVNTTANMDWQTVTYRPELYRWQPDTTGRWNWVWIRSGTWKTPYQQNDVGGTIIFTSEMTKTFPITSGSGSYRVGLSYYWYATDRVGAGSDLLWATHASFFEDAVGYCTY